MTLFIDTSSLLKRYIQEEGTQIMNEQFQNADAIFVSSITKLEVYSALNRRLTDKSLKESDYQKTVAEYNQDANDFHIVKFSIEVELEALSNISKHKLKPLDSLQLASAQICELDRFISSDKKLFDKADSILTCDCLFI